MTPHRSIVVTLLVLCGLLGMAGCTLTEQSRPTNTASMPAATVTPAAIELPLVVAWAENGDLFTWTSIDPMPRRIASGGVIRPILAPDGSQVAYVRGPGSDPRSLWISDVAGTAERQIIDAVTLEAADPTRRINEVVWAADSAALYVNTFTGAHMNARPADDLWHVMAASGPVTRLLADGQGGHMALSPDGTQLALASAGHYAQPGESGGVPAQTALFTLANGERQTVLDYPAVATASQTRWYPDLLWLPDSSGLRTAIPDPELVYGAGITTLWALPVTGDAEPIATVDADYFGLPVFSADGAWIAYMQRRVTPDQPDLNLLVEAVDAPSLTNGGERYAQGAIGQITRPEWLPNALLFTYTHGAEGDTWLGGPGIEPTRFPVISATVTTAHNIIWADAATAVFSASDGDQFGLYFSLQDVPAPASLIASTAAYPFFDAVLP